MNYNLDILQHSLPHDLITKISSFAGYQESPIAKIVKGVDFKNEREMILYGWRYAYDVFIQGVLLTEGSANTEDLCGTMVGLYNYMTGDVRHWKPPPWDRINDSIFMDMLAERLDSITVE